MDEGGGGHVSQFSETLVFPVHFLISYIYGTWDGFLSCQAFEFYERDVVEYFSIIFHQHGGGRGVSAVICNK